MFDKDILFVFNNRMVRFLCWNLLVSVWISLQSRDKYKINVYKHLYCILQLIKIYFIFLCVVSGVKCFNVLILFVHIKTYSCYSFIKECTHIYIGTCFCQFYRWICFTLVSFFRPCRTILVHILFIAETNSGGFTQQFGK